MEIKLYTDGGARGNPGPAAAGIHIVIGSQEYIYGFYLGEKTNNQAEYMALELGLQVISDLIKDDLSSVKLFTFMDSELIVRQINGQYKVKDAKLKEYFTRVKALIKAFAVVEFTHIPRNLNSVADKAVNRVLDVQNGIKTANKKFA